MSEQTNPEQTAAPPTTEVNRVDLLRKQEMLKGVLPSQKIRMIHAEMLQMQLNASWGEIEKQKLRPDCQPQVLRCTKMDIAQVLAKDPNFLMGAILRYVDDCYVFQLGAVLNEEEWAKVISAGQAESHSPASAEAATP